MPSLLGWRNDKIVRLDKFHPNLLNEATRIMNQSWETLVVFAPNFEIWNTKEGTKDEIHLSVKERHQLRDQYILHNHPIPGPFSPKDISICATYGIARAYLIEPNGMLSVMEKPTKGWPKQLMFLSEDPMMDLYMLAMSGDLEGYDLQLERIAYEFKIEYWKVKIQ